MPGAGSHHLCRLRRRHCQRLLTEHVPPSERHGFHFLQVGAWRSGDVHRLHLRIGKAFIQAVVGESCSMYVAQAAGFFEIAADQRHEFGRLHITERRQDRRLCKGAQAKHGKTYWSQH